MEIRQCEVCNNDFMPKVFLHRVCSKECKRVKSKEYMKKYNTAYYIENKDKILKTVSLYAPNKFKCLNCDKEFHAARKKAKYCSEKCKGISFSKTRFGKDSHSYVHGLRITKEGRKTLNYKQSEYIKVCKIIDERQINDKGYIYCEECGTSNSLRFEHHHLIYRSEKPKHEHLHNIKNIFLCCIKCHNLFHKHKSKRNKIVEERKLNELFGDDVLDK